MNIAKIEKDWIARGFSFAVGTIKSGDGVKEAIHDDKDELVLMGTGKYEFIIDNKIFFQQGDIEVLIPAGATHSITNMSLDDATIYYGYKPKNL